MQWTVDFYKTDETSPIDEWLSTLDQTARTKLLRNISLLKEYGLELRIPYVRTIGKKLYEVRAKDTKGIYRLLYFAYTRRTFIMLHGFTKKTEKTPTKEIELAMKRMKEVIDG